ncbi:MAG TPA: NAD(P)H-dependent oxidoreductase [Hyphomicrobiaceae bacterium]|nr:NAD(P)H-dependent oxidoreductase [Hyphomicrobiaceae bacterium]
MDQAVRLLFIAGSAREASFNKRLARLGAEIATANGLPATFADLGDYPMPIYDGDLESREGPPENARKLKALMQVHDGIFIASPEYNAGITPLLKNALDWVSRVREEGEAPLQVYKTRVFAISGASPGRFGAVRGLIALRQSLTLGMGALVLPEQVAIANAAEAFDEQGHLKDKGQQEMLKALIQKLARAARILHGE